MHLCEISPMIECASCVGLAMRRSRLLWLKGSATAFLALNVAGMGGSAIADMGELIHFTCYPRDGRMMCNLVYEPLIGDLQMRWLASSELVKTTVQSKKGVFGGTVSRLVLVTRSNREIPLTRNWSQSANDQLLKQREQIDQFLTNSPSELLMVRTHRPGYLWAILGGLAIVTGIVGIKLWLPEFKRKFEKR